MNRIFFIDVDGTLVTQKGAVPKSASEVIKAVRERGDKVFLSTGRAKSEITDDILSVGFDGIIGSGGAYIEIDDVVLLEKYMDPNEVKQLMAYFADKEVGYYLESVEGLFASDNCVDKIRSVSKRLVQSHPELFVDKEHFEPTWFFEILESSKLKQIPYDRISKVSFISEMHPFSETYETFKNDFEVYHATVFEFGPESGEIGLKDITKRTAIEYVLDYYDMEFETIAFGDGLNDLEMFAAVDYSVAMDNAHADLKLVADEITSIAEDDGISLAFKRNKWV